MKEDKFDNMYEGRFDALQKKYEAEIAIAKTELETYFVVSVGVAEHPHIIESMDAVTRTNGYGSRKIRLAFKGVLIWMICLVSSVDVNG